MKGYKMNILYKIQFWTCQNGENHYKKYKWLYLACEWINDKIYYMIWNIKNYIK